MSFIEPPCFGYWHPVLLRHVETHVGGKGGSLENGREGVVELNPIFKQ